MNFEKKRHRAMDQLPRHVKRVFLDNMIRSYETI